MSNVKESIYITNLVSPSRFQRQSVSQSKSRHRQTEYPKKYLKIGEQIGKKVCYISPKKSLQSLVDKNDPLMMLSIGCKSSRIHPFHLNSETNQKAANTGFRTSRESLPRDNFERNPFEEQMEKCEKQLELLKKHLRASQSKQNRLEEENKFCLDKIEQLSVLLTRKDKQVSTLTNKLHISNLAYDELLIQQRKKEDEISRLNDTIKDLNIQIEKTTAMAVWFQETSESWGEKNLKRDLEKELNQYKSRYEQLIQKVKYADVTENMYKKVVDDYQQQLQTANKYKNMNKKLIRRVQSLTDQLSTIKKQKRYLKIPPSHRQLRQQSSLSISLTPDEV